MRALPTMGLALAVLAVGAGVSASSCSQTPTNVPIRTFEGAQKVAVVCMQVLNVANPSHGPVPVAQDNCAPVPAGVVTTTLPFHLYAAVTQTTRGELAVVDLTTGFVVDEDQSTPGTNFIPVGTNPTDVTIPPDGSFTYVSSASATKPAIYAIDNHRLLGDNSTAGNPLVPPLQLTNLAACSLPQPPLALAIASLPEGSGTDGGSGADGGGLPGPYALIALLGPEGNQPAQVVSIDPTALQTQTPGALSPCVITGKVRLSAEVPPTWLPGPPWPDGVPYVDGGVDLVGQEPALGPPGTCSAPVPVDGSAEPVVANEAGVPEASPAPGADATAGGGLDATAPDAGVDDAAVEDAAIEEAGPEPMLPEAAAPIVAAAEAGALDAGFVLAHSPLSTPNPSSMVMRDDLHLLYVADLSLPLIHVIDVTNPSAPVEIEPLLATSVAQPARPVNVGGLALSPPTRDYKRYLYAIDQTPGSLMVYDVTNGAASPHVPLLRPHAELNPFSPADRITFSAPVATMAFAQHDWPAQLPLVGNGSNAIGNASLAYPGLLCNPNPKAHPNATTFNDIGAYYRVDQAGTIQANATAENFPTRLRGVFAFATLSNGTVVAIDVDDWDAPCRRPDPMTDGGITGSLDVPEPDASTVDGGLDLSPYHVPTAYFAGTDNSLAESSPVTLEPFFPVSAPHRIRSGVLVRNDPTSGIHVPNLVGVPSLADLNGAGVVTSGQMASAQPLLLPTVLEPGFTNPTLVQNPTEPNPASRMSFPEAGTFPDPAAAPTPGVRLSFEDPTVVQNQDWQVTYEGVLPSSTGIFANIASSPPGDFSTLTFTVAGANLCGLGIEDWGIGQLRAQQALRDMKANNLPVSGAEKTLPSWTTDYVEITDDILPSNDPYWSQTQACWDIPDTDLGDGGASGTNTATQRYNLCQAEFGSPGSNPDQAVKRDAPILEAHPDHLKVGRFGFVQLETTANRTVDPGSSNNPTFLKLMACCFHNQAAFKVRAGGEWIAVGQQSIGLLHHVQASQDPAAQNRCVLSCDPKDSLLNARSFDVPWGNPNGKMSCAPAVLDAGPDRGMPPAIGRNDGLAMRNPMFSYVTWAGCGTPMGDAHTLTARDLAWKFSVAGGFSPLAISLSGATAVAVSPQSMLFIPSLGQMAIVDGEQQGLVIVDLNSVTILNNFF